jgi:F0F1-type ATP synthase assembly protein I
MAQPSRKGDMSGLALLTGGAIVVGASIGGYIVGIYIDRVLHSAPAGAVIGLIVGFVIGIIDLYRVAMRIMQAQPAPPPLPPEPDEAETQDADQE